MSHGVRHEPLALKVRRWLEAPLGERPVWTWPAVPFCGVLAWLVACVASARRRKGYGPVFRTPKGHEPWTVCVGNLNMGGSGKSPIVELWARQLVAQGGLWPVGVSRGVGQSSGGGHSRSQEGVVWGLETEPLRPDFAKGLTDENACHAHVWAKGALAQGADRRTALFQLFERHPPLESLNPVVLMDDGHQHFPLGRHLTALVIPPQLLERSPLCPFPLGPWREGWGPEAFRQRLDEVALRLWSRTPVQERASFAKSCHSALARVGLMASAKDFVVEETLAFCRPLPHGGLSPWTGSAEAGVAFQNGRGALAAGIARPEGLVKGLAREWGSKAVDSIPWKLWAGDHAPLPPAWRPFLAAANPILITLKDWFRWKGQLKDWKLESSVWICHVQVALTPLRKDAPHDNAFAQAFPFLAPQCGRSDPLPGPICCGETP